MAAAAAEVERTGYGKMPLLPSELTTGMTASLSGGTESKLSKHYRGERHPFGRHEDARKTILANYVSVKAGVKLKAA